LPFAARSAAFKRRTRTVLTVHDCGFRHFPEAHPLRQRLYLDWSTRFAIRHASVVLTDSEATRRDLIELYRADPARLRVAYPGVTWVQPVGSAERDAVLKRFALTDRRYVLHVGTLQPRKNLRRLIDAFAALTARPGFADCALVLAGGRGWGGEDLNAYARMRGVHHSVRLTGYVDDATRAALLAGAHVYACPSLYEGFGFPVLEAQTHGIAVACSATSSLGEVVGAGAITFDPLDTGAISVALETLLTDADARARAIDAGRKNVQRFSWQSCARMTLAACVDT
jgi:glycosyltransferase involved in cell wall biosynthesis